jgi:hypothetical protein
MRGGEVPGEVLGVWPSPSALPASPSPDGSGAPPPPCPGFGSLSPVAKAVAARSSKAF